MSLTRTDVRVLGGWVKPGHDDLIFCSRLVKNATGWYKFLPRIDSPQNPAAFGKVLAGA